MKQTAEYLQLTEKAVRDYIVEGKLEASKFGRVWRITETDISNFVQSMKPSKVKADDLDFSGNSDEE